MAQASHKGRDQAEQPAALYLGTGASSPFHSTRASTALHAGLERSGLQKPTVKGVPGGALPSLTDPVGDALCGDDVE